MKREALHKEVIEINGIDHQLFKYYEESGELSHALNKARTRKTGKNLDHLAEEIADVELRLEALKVIFGVEGATKQWKKHKTKRLKKRKR